MEIARLRTSAEQPVGSPDVAVDWFSDRSSSTVALAVSRPTADLPRPSDAAQEFLGIALAAYVADRSIVRETTDDGWTRTIRLEVPVYEPGRWNGPELEAAISFLTGDNWDIRLRRGDPTPIQFAGLPAAEQAGAAALFSGGVDSLAGALDLLQDGKRPVLISHYGDSPTATRQNDIASEILGPNESAERLHQFRLTSTPDAVRSGKPWPGLVDTTMRSRSLLFIALGVLVADALGLGALQLAENGYIAINVPLHAGRVGSLSTRTAHPHYLAKLGLALGSAGIGVTITNPYLFDTKGEVTARLLALTDGKVAATTVSCAHPVGRWEGEGYRNCGYCYPCLIRQAGFHAAGRDLTYYAQDPFTDERFYHERAEAASDMRSVARALLDEPALIDILDTGPLPSFALLADLHEMRTRGLQELRDLFDARLSSAVRATLGL